MGMAGGTPPGWIIAFVRKGGRQGRPVPQKGRQECIPCLVMMVEFFVLGDSLFFEYLLVVLLGDVEGGF